MKFPENMTPIWLNNDNNKDEYADFYPAVNFAEGKTYFIRIVCDTDRAIYINDTLVSFGQYADYPGTPVYEDVPLHAKPGDTLKITAWHSGIDSQTHVATEAYIAFCIYENDIPICSSSRRTLCRPTPEYVPYSGKIITSQMGAGFSLNGRTKPSVLSNAVSKDLEIISLRKRATKPLYLDNAISGTILDKSYCKYNGGADYAEIMSNASNVPTPAEADGIYYIFDFGSEHVGFPEIEFSCEEECNVYIGWGEHIIDGKCRSAIHSRRFTTEIISKAGYNHYSPVLRRFGLRYMQLYFTCVKIKNISVKFHPSLLPVEINKTEFKGANAELREKIYNTAIHTLRCCMHEHYEDCPWREQALYTLDSRNQMLAGYKAFKDKNAEFVRANLDLISRGVRSDGILSLCYPAGLDYPIPFYTLAYFWQMNEYIIHTGDTSLASEKFNILVNLLNVFYSRTTESGLALRFPDSQGYWNFYEWSEHLSGSPKSKSLGLYEQPCEANLSAALSLASSSMASICKAINKFEEANYYEQKALAISKSITQTFYNTETGFFIDFTDRPTIPPSALTQALCLLCGSADNVHSDNIISAIANNGGTFGNTIVVPATLSMACFRYDALLKVSKEKFASVILNEIDRDCGYMLERGATTFWETLKGESDFGGAGSLCHGWSAMAAYYYSELL